MFSRIAKVLKVAFTNIKVHSFSEPDEEKEYDETLHKLYAMNNTVLIQLTSPQTMNLLHKLEELHLLRVLKKNIAPNKSLADKYAGKLPIIIAEDLQRHIEQSRNEWDSNSYAHY